MWLWFRKFFFRPGGSFKFALKHFSTTYVAFDSSGKARVAILNRCTCPLRIRSSFSDPHGWFIILACDYINSLLTLKKSILCVRNSGQIHFITDVFDKLQQYPHPLLFIGEDFNLIMFPMKDRQMLFLKLPIRTGS